MFKWALYVVGVLALLIGVTALVGFALPVAHVASVEATFPRPPADVFAAIADVKRYADWRSDVSRVDILADTPRTRWKETGSNGDITFEVVESAPPRVLTSRIADPSLPFGGTWTYDVTPSGSGTRVRITERGEVYNPIFRALSRFIFGHTATMEQFLRDLGRKLR